MSTLSKTTDVATRLSGQRVEMMQSITNYAEQIALRSAQMDSDSSGQLADEFKSLLTSGSFAYLGTGQLSLNLAAFVQCSDSLKPCFDIDDLGNKAYSALRFLDNIAVIYADKPIIRIDGLAEALMLMHVRYDTVEGRRLARSLMRQVRDEIFHAAIRLTFERGTHPDFNSRHYLTKGYGAKLPADFRSDIREFGLRFPQLLTINNHAKACATVFKGVTPGIMPTPAWVYHWTVADADNMLVEMRTTNMMFRKLKPGESMPEHYKTAKELKLTHYDLMVGSIECCIDGPIEELNANIERLMISTPDDKPETVNVAPLKATPRVPSSTVARLFPGLKMVTA